MSKFPIFVYTHSSRTPNNDKDECVFFYSHNEIKRDTVTARHKTQRDTRARSQREKMSELTKTVAIRKRQVLGRIFTYTLSRWIGLAAKSVCFFYISLLLHWKIRSFAYAHALFRCDNKRFIHFGYITYDTYTSKWNKRHPHTCGAHAYNVCIAYTVWAQLAPLLNK